ncbi:hydrolase [Psychromonas marina]|uniref:Hydrolase n=1 Tax=Psychromonas marina TaxID=88364 RepID=A0ABQ6E1D3_9GAMM|nr:isochorismatase family protein [Psychromonas marina]GLS91028.1 hydrolase [Psychromonas marina]
MSFTQIDAKTALLVIDLQYGIVALNTCHPATDIINNCGELINKFRLLSLPICFVNVDGAASGRTEQIKGKTTKPANWSQLISELNPRAGELLITKQTWGAFTNTDLHTLLQAREITQLVICGIATSMGVESTARQAFELGYNISLPIDAMTDINAAVHENSVGAIFPKLSETGTTADLLKLLTT